ncbi:MAG: PilZ domain-containing protein [Myxococcota bacterium]
MKDRRTNERHNLIMYLRVHDQTTDSLVGHVVDVSTGGLMLVTNEAFEPYSQHKLRVLLPYTEDAEQTLDIDVECRWCGPDANEAYYDAGFRFVEPTAELRETIAGVVEDVGFAA